MYLSVKQRVGEMMDFSGSVCRVFEWAIPRHANSKFFLEKL